MYSSETISPNIGENMRRLLRQVLGQEQSASAPLPAAKSGAALRQSKGLREFANCMRPPEGLRVLDLGAASQANINFLTDLGHRVCTEDLHNCLELFSSRTMVTADPDTEAEQFFKENVAFEESQFDGVLCWDLLDFVPDALVKPLIARLHLLLKPGGYLLAFFHSGQQITAGLQEQMQPRDQRFH